MALVLKILKFKRRYLTSIYSIYSMPGSGGESQLRPIFYDNFVIHNTYLCHFLELSMHDVHLVP
jgi:hypothetical protein